MSSLATLARPYAKAAFQLAQAQGQLKRWDEWLERAGAVSSEPAAATVLTSPHVSAEQALDLIADAMGEAIDERFRGYLSVLSENGRLLLLGQISAIYHRLRQQAERCLEVRVVSAVPLDEDQQERMRKALARRLDSDIELKAEIDESVIGGAVVYAGDEVIDGSLLGRLQKLERSLTS